MEQTLKPNLLHGAGAIAGMRLSHKVYDLSLDLFVTMFLWNETNSDMGGLMFL